MLWRYEDLKERYSLLSREGAPMHGEDYFSKNDYRYAPIECFNTLSDVYRAMEIAKEDLKEKCGIFTDDETAPREEDEAGENQMSFPMVVLLPSWFQTAAAA